MSHSLVAQAHGLQVHHTVSQTHLRGISGPHWGRPALYDGLVAPGLHRGHGCPCGTHKQQRLAACCALSSPLCSVCPGRWPGPKQVLSSNWPCVCAYELAAATFEGHCPALKKDPWLPTPLQTAGHCRLDRTIDAIGVYPRHRPLAHQVAHDLRMLIQLNLCSTRSRKSRHQHLIRHSTAPHSTV